jgi:hypothetical protein
LQHAPPGLAIPDLQPVAFQFEGTWLVSAGEIRRQAAFDMVVTTLVSASTV